ncbi:MULTISPECIES: TetR/AcrR family transcriptional regulator [unclassified Nostoc]|jgi:AcrR family transcriptional regulator|uniref:TetR/AcrR family transcriptional regulator n=1 Tax=unclassified Nostoc TaxID=2593658 RepID=UPI000DEC5CC5|nr:MULTISPECIES: TetR/AcrR family transcriptional regulator [unclassified Nostoc]MBD2511951.1 TetR/AcrR family transcriptional regulator [Desmonostoc muscorum FACHB-395]MBD2522084.1 TetR/AcrR family transcriptional regulator [Nostoc sp. FACHB-133]QHG16465.1 TetR family transcriptional regulator [Nostoc sp. ATCC 53789]RCJ30749.1 TetR family transcriptional regulator [Nostoc sp. ATCC 53789]
MKPKDKYHHGNLRNKLIAIATELLSEEGAHSLSLRKISQRAGVSHNAPYMHFADKEAVLAAIAEEGFRLLSAQVETAIKEVNKDTKQQLIAASSAYVNFALEHSNHLQVMFCYYNPEKYPSLIEVSQTSLDQLFKIVQAGQKDGTLIAGNPHEITKTIWALVHGVAAISIAYESKIILPEKNSAQEVVSTFVTLLLNGLAR